MHHIYPVRFYGRGRHNNAKLPLCSDCHIEIDKILEGKLKLHKDHYYQIHRRWMMGINPMIITKEVYYAGSRQRKR